MVGGPLATARRPAAASCWATLPTPAVVPIGARCEQDAEPQVAQPGWECAACTFVNSVGEGPEQQCAICEMSRSERAPAPAPPPPQHQPEPEPRTVSAVDVAGGHGDAECSICIDTMDAADVAIAECGHRFCTACILQWLDVGHQHCPMCKASISHLRVLRQLDGTRVAEPITEPVVLLLRARWRERPTVLPPDDVQPERSAVGDWDHDYGFDEEADVLLRVRASSRVNAEHRALVRAAGGGGARRPAAPKSKKDGAARAASRPSTVATQEEKEKASARSPFAGMVGCQYRCVAQKAYATEELAPTPSAGLEVAVVEHDAVVTCLEARMVAGSKGQSLRLRCEAGWVSYVAANGTQLFELASAADGSAAALAPSRSSSSRGQRGGGKASDGGGGAGGGGGKKAKKKERREEKAAAKAARRAAARREHKLALELASTRTPPATPRGGAAAAASATQREQEREQSARSRGRRGLLPHRLRDLGAVGEAAGGAGGGKPGTAAWLAHYKYTEVGEAAGGVGGGKPGTAAWLAHYKYTEVGEAAGG
eukprot:COSAG06_NODE_9566_length_1869_cov_3.545198_1_plen_540_part_01